MKKVIIMLFILLSITGVSGIVYYNYKQDLKTKIEIKNKEEKQKELERIAQEEKEKKELEQKQKYENCKKSPYQMPTLEEEFNNVFDKYKNEHLALYFTDVKNEYSFKYNSKKSYYSGCVVKLFAIIYLIEQAREGKIDLHDTYTYLPQDRHAYSDLTDKHPYYDKIPITTLIEYMLLVSDNSAYMIVIRNVGAQTINNYFYEKYNVVLHFTNTHPFEAGYNAELGNKSLELLYNTLQVDDEYTKLVKDSMLVAEENALNFDDIKILHKYGELAPYHNDIGIYDGEYPYLVTILSLYANDDYITKMSKVSKDMYLVYKKNIDSKETYCYNLAYNE
jgi:predicted Holliday junction resolvase-like endonuclease